MGDVVTVAVISATVVGIYVTVIIIFVTVFVTLGVSTLPPGEVLQSVRLTRIESLLTEDKVEIREAEICLSVDIPP